MNEQIRETPRGNTTDLMRELAEARESYRTDLAQLKEERQKLRRDQEETQQLQTSAVTVRERARQSYRRFMKQLKRKWSRERTAIEAERKELQQFREEVETQREENQLFDQRLRAAWDQLHATQLQLQHDRHHAEQQIHDQNTMLERRATTLIQQEKHFETTEAELVSRIRTLSAEVAGLDERAGNARTTLEQLEARIQTQSKLDPFGDASSLVPIGKYQPVQPYISGDAESLLQDLHTRQQELDRARRKIIAARDEIEHQATTLEDQRAVLIDQVAALVTARELWSSAEIATVGELETMAQALCEREQHIASQETTLTEGLKQVEQREAALIKLRDDLDNWRNLLLAEASATLSVRDHAREKVAHFQHDLQARQAELDGVVRMWAEIREKERGQYTGVLEHFGKLSQESEIAGVRAEEVRVRYLEDSRNVASLQLALEQTINDNGLAGKRRLRILQRRWERHFTRWQADLETKTKRIDAEKLNAQKLNRELCETMQRWLDERTKAFDEQIIRDDHTFDRLERPIDLSALNMQQVENELQQLREQIDKMTMHRSSE